MHTDALFRLRVLSPSEPTGIREKRDRTLPKLHREAKYLVSNHYPLLYLLRHS